MTVTVHPGGEGIAFRVGGQRVAADPANVVDTARCTLLGPVSTVEHLMAAFAGLEITDAEVELTAPEMPAMDGASLAFCTGLLSAGFDVIGSVSVQGPFARVFLQEDALKVAVSTGSGHWRYEFDTGDRWPGTLGYEAIDVVAAFPAEIAPARTFAFAEEVLALLELGFAKGLGPDTALVLGEEGYKGDPKFEDEPARHKLLDCLGDLYLTGIPVRALNVVAERSGHRSHVDAAKLLAAAVTLERT